jgi:hypothetical protein
VAGTTAERDDVVPGFSEPERRGLGEGDEGNGMAGDEEVEEFAFRLFGGEEARQIVIQEEDEGQGGFVKAWDPRVFILGKAEGERRRGFENVAISGEEVLKRRKERAWGLEVPWRVVVVRGPSVGGGGGRKMKGEGSGVEGKRKRVGKKRRIAIRVKKRTGDEERERRKKEEAEREEREREKRTRRNREKKVKRKMKEKAKKAGGGEGGDASDPPVALDDEQGD